MGDPNCLRASSAEAVTNLQNHTNNKEQLDDSFYSCRSYHNNSPAIEMKNFGVDDGGLFQKSSGHSTTTFPTLTESSLNQSPSPPILGGGRFSLDSCSIKRFSIQALLVWTVLSVPGNMATIYLYATSDPNNMPTLQTMISNMSSLSCHEKKSEYNTTKEMSNFYIEGVSITVVGAFGMAANILSVFILLRCEENRNFHRLLACLAIVDILLIADLVFEMSIIGVFWGTEPTWFKLAYPYFFHPGRGIIQTAAIYMVVAVATERYRAVCHPMVHRQGYYKYVGIVALLAAGIEFPRFFEFKLNAERTGYWTTALMENPNYVRFSSYWIDVVVTGLFPLILLSYMNFRIFLKIKASSRFAVRFVANKHPVNLSTTENNKDVTTTIGATMTTGTVSARPEDEESLDNVASMCRRNRLNGLPKSWSVYTSREYNTLLAKAEKITNGAKTGTHYIRRRKEKSTMILIAIIAVFVICHCNRLAFKVYEMAHPENAIYEHYLRCAAQGRYHVPVALYILADANYLALALNSSINFVIYCFMGRHFRQQLKIAMSQLWNLMRMRCNRSRQGEVVIQDIPELPDDVDVNDQET